ncbi:MAG: hypothetical protein CBB68_06200 [Rhodospirillaceae bacterium TMED8]|nr:hypothetical protein [Magnetovibrio sp.]OUT51214.1 MAG: hypothetical protein CBB68_06200 [Rhodospirillaceae bacterium TMED8]
MAVFLLFAAALPAVAQSDPTPQQLMKMIEAQQRQLDAMKTALKKAQDVADTAVNKADAAAKTVPGLPNGFEFGGALEIETTQSETYAGVDSSDVTLAKVEAYFDAQPNEYLSTHFQIIYEDDGTETIALDEAYAIIGNTDEVPMYLQAGKWAVPFGGFDTSMNTDPLTKTLGETAEAALLVGYSKNGFTFEGYGYNGDTQQDGDEDEIDQFGFQGSYETEMDGTTVSIGAGYLSNIADSGTITDNVTGGTALDDYIPGWEVHGTLTRGPLVIYGGYMTAKDSFASGELAFNSQGAQPAAWNLEAAYVTELMGKETTFAATVQGSDEAFALSMPETRYGGAVTVQLISNYFATFEYLHDEDYSTSDGGTGDDGHTATFKLAAEF